MFFNRIMNSSLRSQLVVLVFLCAASIGALFIPVDTSWQKPEIILVGIPVPIMVENCGKNAQYNPGSEFVKILDEEI